MFTGIITEIGKVKSIVARGASSRLEVICDRTGDNVKTGDSIAVNGVCLSVVDSAKGTLSFDVVDNTMESTNLKRLKPGDTINLENALKLGDTISGHMVSGHIDAERIIRNNKKTSAGWVIEIAITPEDRRYLVPKGSISIDGVSLTVGDILQGYVRIFLIPHTLDNSTLISRKTGDYVNIEFDMMGKYSEKKIFNKGSITSEMLREKGFM